MPTSRKHRFNTSDTVKARIRNILCEAIKQVNSIRIDKPLAKWQKSDRHRPKLMVKCKTREFTKLCYPTVDADKTGTILYNDMWVLREWLGILEEHRMETKGVKELHFTLNLWSKQTKLNLDNLEQLWEEKKHPTVSPPRVLPLRHNLPAGQYTTFVGYQSQFDRLTNLLSNNASKLISVDGIAGSGKTSLVLEVVHRYCESTHNKFQTIVFTSAQPSYCLPKGIIDRVQIDRNLSDILRQILTTLDTLDILPTELTELLASTKQALATKATLLIIDNIETTEDQQSLFAFLHELPPTVTTLITSRIKLGLGEIISLSGLDGTDSIQLINQIATQKNLSLTHQQIELVWQKTDGIPLAINYILSCAYLAGSITALNLDRPLPPGSDLINYCFGNLITRIRGEFTHRLLMALSLFSHPVPQAAAVFITNLQDYPLQSLTALKELEFLNLILQPQAKYYALHSLTREYSRHELIQDRSYEADYLTRWVTYYLQDTDPYGKLDWKEWQDYRALDREWLNIRDVVEYCIATDRLEDFDRLWHNLHGYTLICGKWSERLVWLEWWVNVITESPDCHTQRLRGRLATALYHQSQTLAHRNETDPSGKSIELAHLAWNACKQLDATTHINLRFDIALHLASLYIRQQQSPPLDFCLAHQWLDTANQLLDGDKERSQILYYQAEIEYCSGNYHEAKRLYQQTKQLAAEIGFTRLTTYANSRRAICAIALRELEEALSIVKDVLQAAQTNQDRRSIALSQYYLAIIERDRGNLTTAKDWAGQAIQSLDRLFMKQEAANMLALLEEVR
jgi:Effector-associated domain 4/NB-ARC domain/MalT-like TPR region